MSSILDALRKVETEKAKKKVELGEVEEMLAEKDLLVPDEEELPRRVRRLNRVVIGVVASLAMAGVFGAAAFFLYGVLKARQVTESQAAFPVPPQVPQATVPQPGQFTSQERPPAPAQLARDAVNEPSATPPGVAEPTGAVPEPPSLPSEVPEPPVSTPTMDRAAVDAPVKRPAQRPELKINILRPPSEQFPTPQAVVNGKKVGVGGYIDGAKVIKIQDGGIVFEYGDDLFLVKF